MTRDYGLPFHHMHQYIYFLLFLGTLVWKSFFLLLAHFHSSIFKFNQIANILPSAGYDSLHCPSFLTYYQIHIFKGVQS